MRISALPLKMKYTLPILLGILANLSLIDLVLTDYAITKGFIELNPLSRWLLEHGLFHTVKIGGIVEIIFSCGLVGWAESKDMFVEYQKVYDVLTGLIILVIVGQFIVIFNNALRIGT